MSVASPPVWSDPTNVALDVQTGGQVTQTTMDGICSDLAVLGGTDGVSGIAGKPNLLTDGGFEVWDRGAGAFTAGGGGTYVANIWVATASQASGGPVSLTVAKETGSTNVSGASAKLVWARNGATNPSGIMAQKLEDYLELKGKSVAFAMDINATAAGVQLAIGDVSSNTATSALSTSVNAWQRLTVATTVPLTGTLYVRVYMPTTADCTCYLDNGMLVGGTAPSAYIPLHPNDENSRCKRYYQVTRVSMRNDAANAGQITDMPVYYQDMLAAPTVTVTAGTRANQSGSPSANDVQSNNLRYEMTASAGANTATYALRDVLTLESDP